MMENRSNKTRPIQTSREEFTELFVDVIRICKPDHPYYEDSNPYKNISKDDIVTSYCREDSKYHAKCGPRRDPMVAKYSIDLEYFQSRPLFEDLAINIHEATHITIGSHNEDTSTSHPPRFWVKMCENAKLLLDNWDVVQEKWGPIDARLFKERLMKDPNKEMVDRRRQTVQEVQDKVRELIEGYEPCGPNA